MMRKFTLPPSASLAAWLVLFPAALFALGFWQAERATETRGQTRQSVAELQTMLAKVKEIAATDPATLLTFQGDDGEQSFSALVALPKIEAALSRADEDLEISSIRAPFPWGTIGGAVLAFGSGLLGLATATISGLRARQSQRQLIGSFSRLRIILPFILAALVIGICIATVCGTLFEAISLGLWAGLSSTSAKLFVAALILAGVAAYSAYLALRGLKDVFALFTPEPLNLLGRVIDEAYAPQLFRLVRDIAERQQALLPDTIIVGLTQGFFVTESQVRLLPEDRPIDGRSLYLPAPYLDLLDKPEVAPIIAHELAHFTGEDTAYTQKFTPIYAGLWRALAALRRAERGSFILYPATRLGFHTIQQFDHAVNHWSRIREFDADLNSSRTTSAIGAASALIRAGVIAPALDHVLSQAGARLSVTDSDGADADLVAETTDLVRGNGWSDPIQLLKDRQPHPTDTHPPTIQRIQALGLTADERLLKLATRVPQPLGSTFGASLFSDWAGLCRLLSRDYLDEVGRMRAQRQRALEAFAAAVPGETIVHDNVKPMIWVLAIVAVVFAGFGLMVTAFPAQTGFANDAFARLLVAGIAVVGVIACSLYAVFLHRQAARPLMILTPTELRATMLHAPIAWTDVGRYQVHASNRFALRLWLAPSASLPSKQWRALYSKVDRKQRIVTIAALGIRGMTATKFNELIGRYLNAAYARRELYETSKSNLKHQSGPDRGTGKSETENVSEL